MSNLQNQHKVHALSIALGQAPVEWVETNIKNKIKKLPQDTNSTYSRRMINFMLETGITPPSS